MSRFTCDAVRRDTISHLDSINPGMGIFFQRQLEYINPQILRVKRPVPNGLRLFAVDTSVPEGFLTYTERMLEHIGEADWISGGAGDFPAVDLGATERTKHIKPIGDSYSYNLMEIKAAQLTGTNLSLEKGLAARQAIERRLNRVVWEGDLNVGVHGVLTHPDVPWYVMPNNLQAGFAQLVGDVTAAINDIPNETAQVEVPTRVICAPRVNQALMQTSNANTDQTLWDQVFKANAYITNKSQIEVASELQGAGPAGQDLMIIDRPDQLVMKHTLVRGFTPLPSMSLDGWKFETKCYAITGGMSSTFPMAMRICVWP